mmetsp:Transcript_41234/g.108737  ORF Transcript_41234/g.108737 Transcript_41234/m.108737 type:complete len:97 (-) Transcript_41234:58-348(-)|eukprot:CAMPEP_0115755818 /NCGR_PEP_ID=MMETSP0272-20121206/97588_1 /TAXON_ID=71861 /ORGANISM="Scrippsiella trochoidea, Strain CCMP3099" /LENGTH=96 /DNA_ID=CAMNT_0003201281 /DNA_START=78 /DNA_END=368 /DNA_ORIENTATION=+
MASWAQGEDAMEDRLAAPRRTSGKAPMGFSAAAAEREHLRRHTADRAAADDDAGDGGEREVPIEIQPHSYDKLLIKDFKGVDGPWFCYAWVDKSKK